MAAIDLKAETDKFIDAVATAATDGHELLSMLEFARRSVEGAMQVIDAQNTREHAEAVLVQRAAKLGVTVEALKSSIASAEFGQPPEKVDPVKMVRCVLAQPKPEVPKPPKPPKR